MATVRRASPELLDTRREEFIDVYLQLWDAPYWDDVDRADALAEINEAQDCDATVVVATDEDVLAGVAWAFHHACRNDPYPADPTFQQQLTDETAYIALLGVIPAYRGQGIGARLMDRLLEELRPDYDRAVLRTHPDAERAWRIYEECGFSDVDVPDPERPDRTYLVKELI